MKSRVRPFTFQNDSALPSFSPSPFQNARLYSEIPSHLRILLEGKYIQTKQEIYIGGNNKKQENPFKYHEQNKTKL